MNHFIGLILWLQIRSTVSGQFHFYWSESVAEFKFWREKDQIWGFMDASRKMYKMLEYEKLDS